MSEEHSSAETSELARLRAGRRVRNKGDRRGRAGGARQT